MVSAMPVVPNRSISPPRALALVLAGWLVPLSQDPMLVLMVGYTMVSLWIIAQPIVESSPAG